MPIRKNPDAEQGFALIVVTALFVAFALLATAIIDRSNATKQLDAVAKTREKISRISNALIEYSVFNANHPYPCPAEVNVAVTDSSFGTSVSDCIDTVFIPTGISALAEDGLGQATIVRGMVPVATLASYGVSTEDAFDAWGNRIMYIVDSWLTVPSYILSSTPIVITEYNTGESFSRPDFIVMSYGKDGLGATPKSTISITVACPTDSSLRSDNCDEPGAGTPIEFKQGPINAAPGTSASTYFDDILSFYARAH